ncbi:MAG TPA: toll/interleukin-1 receptor domain-containing protein [Candidatus Cybelea sp.]|jgi:hypothetical protein
MNLRFELDADEAAFAASFCFSKKQFLQPTLIFGSIFAYIFFIWDAIIDPAHAQTTHLIRGLFLTPIVWVAAGALFLAKNAVQMECILIGVALIFAATLALIFHILTNGFDYGAAGVMLFLLFIYALVPLRTTGMALVSIGTWGSFVGFELAAATIKPGMLLVNNLLLGSAVAFGTFSTVSREIERRKQYLTPAKLRSSEHRLGQMSETNEALRKTTERLLGTAGLNLFVSYRRADSEAITGRIRDRLVDRFGEASAFMDIDSIPFGLDFREEIGLAARKTDTVLAVIGPHWRGDTTAGRPRLWDKGDPVRVELETALRRGIPIIPVLVMGAAMPASSELPPSLKELSFRNAIEVDAGRDFHPHVDRLIRSIEASVLQIKAGLH